MTAPLYKGCVDGLPLHASGHAGLWSERFFDGYSPSWGLPKDSKSRFLDDTCRVFTSDTVPKHSSQIEAAAKRQMRLVASLGGQSQIFETHGPLVTGLGRPHPVENGLIWHPTLGVPYLCGAAVKGLVRAWVEGWDETLKCGVARSERLKSWFGDQESAGGLIFFDALPVRAVGLATDVMTPHMGEWYAKGGDEVGNPRNSPESVPADWHDPVPIPFLVVERGAYVFSLAARTPECAGEIGSALAVLGLALDLLGAGGKTAAGYGRMIGVAQGTSSIEAEVQAGIAKVEEDAALALLSPVRREIEMLLSENRASGQSDWSSLFRFVVNEPRWDGSDLLEAAEALKEMMSRSSTWLEQKPVGQGVKKKVNKGKMKNHERTLAVLKILNLATGS